MIIYLTDQNDNPITLKDNNLTPVLKLAQCREVREDPANPQPREREDNSLVIR